MRYLLILLLLVATQADAMMLIAGKPPSGVTYLTEDCFETGSDADDLATYSAWSLLTGTNGGAEIDDALNIDSGPCSSGSMSLLVTPAGSSPKEYEQTIAPTGATYTVAFEYQEVTALGDTHYQNIFVVYDSGDAIKTVLRTRQDADANLDLELYYDSDDSGTADAYTTICSDCISDSAATEIEFEITEDGSDTVNSIWVGGTEYNTGWNISENDADSLIIQAFGNVARAFRIDSLRSYDGSRNASY